MEAPRIIIRLQSTLTGVNAPYLLHLLHLLTYR
jgi:hypothetical protein